MKTHTTDGRWFQLSAECEADAAFLDAIDMGGLQLHVVQMVRPGRHNTGVVLSVDRNDPRALRAQAASQLARAFGELIRLGVHEVGALRAPPTAAEVAREAERLQALRHSAATHAGRGPEAAS